ncbi:MAG TPA: hypothetical protein VM370_12565 [Candidatus Thermoplasmatota archaeon]|nr:hypothetical protein [Candidatus Thermoplasmatota archaeon]
MPSPAKALVVVTLVTLLLPSLVSPAASSPAPGCADPRDVPGIGRACVLAPGLYHVLSPDGRSLGLTHGPDPSPGPQDPPQGVRSSASVASRIACAEVTDAYFVHVIYAFARDDVDAYGTTVPGLRAAINSSNALVDASAIETSDHLSIRALCAGGIVRVEKEMLDTSRAAATFSTIVGELQARGYDDPRQKYWVYYDDAAPCACSGIGNIYFDESASVDNLNNAGPGAEPMYGVVFASHDPRALLHELGHMLGAVQDGAPYSTLAGHCYDGRDVMCYNDGGPRGGLYQAAYCDSDAFDCNHNTYCHAYPLPESYLASHWQACSRLSRFLVYPPNEPPIVEAFSCSPSPSYADEPVTCTIQVADAAPNLTYAIDWGDGTTESRVERSGVVVTATHTYLTEGDRALGVVVTDVGFPPLASEPASLAQKVLPANVPPSLDALTCAPLAPREGDVVACTVRADDEDELSYTIEWGDASASERMPASGTLRAGDARTLTHAFPRGGAFVVNVTALDAGRPPRSARVDATLQVEDVNDAPVIGPLACPISRPRPGQVVSCTFAASDDSAGVSYLVDWGDGTRTRVPESGFVSPGTTRSATHAYAGEGDFAANVVASDDGAPPMTSAARTKTFLVATDHEGPSMVLSEPATGGVYFGCSKLLLPAPAGVPVFIQRGCVKLTASDPSGVSRIDVLRGTSVLASDAVAPYALEFDVPAAERNAIFTVRAVDGRGTASLQTFHATAILGDE